MALPLVPEGFSIGILFTRMKTFASKTGLLAVRDTLNYSSTHNYNHSNDEQSSKLTNVPSQMTNSSVILTTSRI